MAEHVHMVWHICHRPLLWHLGAPLLLGVPMDRASIGMQGTRVHLVYGVIGLQCTNPACSPCAMCMLHLKLLLITDHLPLKAHWGGPNRNLSSNQAAFVLTMSCSVVACSQRNCVLPAVGRRLQGLAGLPF